MRFLFYNFEAISGKKASNYNRVTFEIRFERCDSLSQRRSPHHCNGVLHQNLCDCIVPANEEDRVQWSCTDEISNLSARTRPGKESCKTAY